MMEHISVNIEIPTGTEAGELLEELSRELEGITGNNGKHSFDISDISDPRAVFVMARNQSGKAVGCGAIRPFNDEIAELKRVYSRVKKSGIGKAVVKYLETKAIELGYSAIYLETRLINENAVSFYEGLGYLKIPNYGKYQDRPEAVCFEKRLVIEGGIS
ncbi:MAG: acetyltransferase [Eubacterium sp.]|jgi:ribosomal protein S18 acetylase RimI-like enzyme|nr:acetyltransferase [Eubacterium sp.]